MNFLVDTQLPPALARWVAGKNHHAIHTIDVGLESAEDSAIWDYAHKNQMIIISKDEDFVDRWLSQSNGAGLIWIRKGNCSTRVLLAWFEPLWPNILERLEQGDRFVELQA